MDGASFHEKPAIPCIERRLTRRGSMEFLSRADYALSVSRMLQPVKAPSSGQATLPDSPQSNLDSSRAISIGHRRLSMVVLSVDTDCKPLAPPSFGHAAPPGAASPRHARRLSLLYSNNASNPSSPMLNSYSRNVGCAGSSCSVGDSPTTAESERLNRYSPTGPLPKTISHGAICSPHRPCHDDASATLSETVSETGSPLPSMQPGQGYTTSPSTGPVSPSRQPFSHTASCGQPASPSSLCPASPGSFTRSPSHMAVSRDRERGRQPFSALRAACNHLARSPSIDAGLSTLGRFGSATRRNSLHTGLPPPNLLAMLGTPWSPTGDDDSPTRDAVVLPLQHSFARSSGGAEGVSGRRHSVMLAPGSSDSIMINWAPRPGRREEHRHGLGFGDGGQEYAVGSSPPTVPRGFMAPHVSDHVTMPHGVEVHGGLPRVHTRTRPGHGMLPMSNSSQAVSSAMRARV